MHTVEVPISLLSTSTPAVVRDYCKELVDIAGEDWGFILTSGACLGEAKPENVKAMIDFTKEYGKY